MHDKLALSLSFLQVQGKIRNFKLERSCTSYHELTPCAVSKDKWDTKDDKVSPRCVHCTYCGMPKGTFQTEATSNSKKIKPIALAVIELHLSAVRK